MVGHFLQPNRRNRSLSQPTDGTNTNGTVDSISGSSIGSGDNTGNVIPVIASHVTHKNNATIDVNSSFGYNVNNVTISNVNDNSNNTNGTSNHHHHRHPQHSAMASSSQYPVTTHQAAAIAPPTMYDISSSSMQYMPPQNLTAEAVAALPPPGPFIWNVRLIVEVCFFFFSSCVVIVEKRLHLKFEVFLLILTTHQPTNIPTFSLFFFFQVYLVQLQSNSVPKLTTTMMRRVVAAKNLSILYLSPNLPNRRHHLLLLRIVVEDYERQHVLWIPQSQPLWFLLLKDSYVY